MTSSSWPASHGVIGRGARFAVPWHAAQAFAFTSPRAGSPFECAGIAPAARTSARKTKARRMRFIRRAETRSSIDYLL